MSNNSKPLVWYIHGANSTSVSFRYIRPRLPEHDFEDIEYNCSTPVKIIISDLIEKARSEQRPINVISHSLGGVIAVSLSHHTPIAKIATMGTPFGGSRVASLLRWIAPAQLFEDIHPKSLPMLDLKSKPVSVPVMSIVTTAGSNPFIIEPNDGVVTVASQRALEGPNYIDLPSNHFEVLLHDAAINLIRDFIFE